jgi:hypothetical protein
MLRHQLENQEPELGYAALPGGVVRVASAETQSVWNSILARQVTPDEVHQALARQIDKRAPLRRYVIETGWVLGVCTLQFGGIFTLLNGDLLQATGFGLGMIPMALFRRNYDRRNLERDMRQLVKAHTGWIGPLLEERTWPNPRLQAIADGLLTHLLPQMTRADMSRLSAPQRQELYRLLRFSRKREALTCAALAGLAQAGGEEAIPHIEHLVNQTPWLPAYLRIQQAAVACLNQIEARRAQGHLTTESIERENAAPVLRPRNRRRRSLRPEELAIQNAPLAERAALVQQMPALSVSSSAAIARRPSAAVEKLLTDLQKEKERYQQPGMRYGFLVASWLVIVPYTTWQSIAHLADRNWLTGLIFGGMAAGTTQLQRLTLSFEQSNLIRKLADARDPSSIGPLAEALEWPDARTQDIAIRTLTVLLRRARASDAPRISAAQRACLYRRLKWSSVRKPRERELMLSLLKALEQIGDQAAIPYVMALLENTGQTSDQKKVIEAARQCLPYLQQNAEQINYRSTLLRPSSAAAASPETLLRSAAASETPAEQLLRPAE